MRVFFYFTRGFTLSSSRLFNFSISRSTVAISHASQNAMSHLTHQKSQHTTVGSRHVMQSGWNASQENA